MIGTSIEQSKKLLGLGLSPESADMCYPPYYVGDEDGDHLYYDKPKNAKKDELSYGKTNSDEYIPAWSLSALLELMPYFTLDKNNPKFYKDAENPYNCFNDKHGEMDYSTPIDAAYNMMVWFLENNYKI